MALEALYLNMPVVDGSGNKAPNIAFTINLNGSLATLYTDRTSGIIGPNPISSNAFSQLEIFAAPGTYTATSSLSGAFGSFSFTITADPQTFLTTSAASGTYASLAMQLLDWSLTQSFRLVSATRDGNEAITTASVVWPDGASGTFTTDTASAAFPGAIDAYHVTHVLNAVTQTVTQTAVTRDANGAVTAQPALTVA